MKSKDEIQTKGTRGSQKLLRATGVDNSSYGDTGAKNINSANGDGMKGGRADLSRTIKDGKVPGY